ncbi:MAG TPA: DUF47 family protein [Isosphaeraceae bacterium]|jgi:hypothetical protein
MWIDRAVKWLLPREEHFFDLLERGAACARECSTFLVSCCGDQAGVDRDALVQQMHDIEHEADRIIAEVYEALNRTFVTPLDRSDIYALATALEGITDDIFATVLQVVVHAMEDLPAGSCELAATIQQACAEIQTAVGLLRGTKRLGEIREICKRISLLESEGDRIYRTQVGELFRTETDAIRLLKHKEFLEGLEGTLDVCDDVGNALETIVIKNA